MSGYAGETRARRMHAAGTGILIDDRGETWPDSSPVLAHRLLPKSFRQGATGEAAEQVIAEIMQNTPVPV